MKSDEAQSGGIEPISVAQPPVKRPRSWRWLVVQSVAFGILTLLSAASSVGIYQSIDRYGDQVAVALEATAELAAGRSVPAENLPLGVPPEMGELGETPEQTSQRIDVLLARASLGETILSTFSTVFITLVTASFVSTGLALGRLGKALRVRRGVED